jgi:DNA-directed RNA polymerase specialized sigma24 family protein
MQPGTDLRASLFTIMHNLNVNEVRRAIRDDATIDLENCSDNLTATTDPTVSRQLRDGSPMNSYTPRPSQRRNFGKLSAPFGERLIQKSLGIGVDLRLGYSFR